MSRICMTLFLIVVLLAGSNTTPALADDQAPIGVLVFQSDFGLSDGAVSAMHGVAYEISADLIIDDITHDVPPFNVWEGAYRLWQAAPYWPKGTVFVSVVDPGVGTDRKSVVMKSGSGHFFVTPDNGTLTLVARHLGVEALREIDESVHRRPGSEASHTFHGRDVYAITGARLAAGATDFESVGSLLDPEPLMIPFREATMEGQVITGNIPILDVRYGNVWTNIGESLLAAADIEAGDSVAITIAQSDRPILSSVMPFAATFGDVPVGESLLYINSLGNAALGLNMANFAEKFSISSGSAWTVSIEKADMLEPGP